MAIQGRVLDWDVLLEKINLLEVCRWKRKAAISFWGFEAKHEALNCLKEVIVKEGVHRITRG
jgi:hypothetical protein